MNLRYLKNDHDLAVQDSVKRIGASKASHFGAILPAQGVAELASNECPIFRLLGFHPSCEPSLEVELALSHREIAEDIVDQALAVAQFKPVVYPARPQLSVLLFATPDEGFDPLTRVKCL